MKLQCNHGHNLGLAKALGSLSRVTTEVEVAWCSYKWNESQVLVEAVPGLLHDESMGKSLTTEREKQWAPNDQGGSATKSSQSCRVDLFSAGIMKYNSMYQV